MALPSLCLTHNPFLVGTRQLLPNSKTSVRQPSKTIVIPKPNHSLAWGWVGGCLHTHIVGEEPPLFFDFFLLFFFLDATAPPPPKPADKTVVEVGAADSEEGPTTNPFPRHPRRLPIRNGNESLETLIVLLIVLFS